MDILFLKATPLCHGDILSLNSRNGMQVVQEKKVLEVHVEKGIQNGQKITFPEEAS
ncbi:dnaJ protein [Artemisia annua]|uniref:DnaJ protein n=1 Tax=Artemisia annua TaxID=35608 RepID=A0A2U1N1C8_ARTAN|nr:dnaJ protein [Artemisia annua]